MMENCLTYALREWKFWRSSDHLDIRRSKWGWFPHFSVIYELPNGDLEKREYVPIKPRQQWLPPLFFKGEERITYYQRVPCFRGVRVSVFGD